MLQSPGQPAIGESRRRKRTLRFENPRATGFGAKKLAACRLVTQKQVGRRRRMENGGESVLGSSGVFVRTTSWQRCGDGPPRTVLVGSISCGTKTVSCEASYCGTPRDGSRQVPAVDLG